MSKPIIAVDIDDVLTRGVESLRRQVNERYGLDLSPEDYVLPSDEYHGYYERVWQKLGVADKVDWSELSQMETDQSMILPNEQALPVLRELAERYELVIVTARSLTWEQATYPWLDKHFSGVFSHVYFAGHKDTASTKAEECKKFGASYLIDDNPRHAAQALECGVKIILFGDYGWQMKQDIPPEMARCKDWPAVLEYFDGLSRS